MLEVMGYHTFPQSTAVFMMAADRATTSWSLVLVSPQLPRPGVKKVPFQ
jgi:hypothetical protein